MSVLKERRSWSSRGNFQPEDGGQAQSHLVPLASWLVGDVCIRHEPLQGPGKRA